MRFAPFRACLRLRLRLMTHRAGPVPKKAEPVLEPESFSPDYWAGIDRSVDASRENRYHKQMGEANFGAGMAPLLRWESNHNLAWHDSGQIDDKRVIRSVKGPSRSSVWQTRGTSGNGRSKEPRRLICFRHKRLPSVGKRDRGA